MASQSAEIIELKKTCKKCGVEKPFSDFITEKNRNDGITSGCRVCVNARRRLKIRRRVAKPVKTCTRCGIEKPLAEFAKHKYAKIDGHLNQCSVCRNKYQSDYGKKNRVRRREYVRFHSRKHVLKKQYKLTIEDYTNLYNSQGGKCAICDKEIALMAHSTHVDHCHISGKVRGVLCRLCNQGLGSFKDNEESLRKAINYLLLSRMV